MITKEDFLKGKYKVLPRIMMLVSTIMSWNTASWFMNLEDPTAPQSAFVSVVMGITRSYMFYILFREFVRAESNFKLKFSFY